MKGTVFTRHSSPRSVSWEIEEFSLISQTGNQHDATTLHHDHCRCRGEPFQFRHNPFSTPLGADLFENLMNFSPFFEEIPQETRMAFKTNFEKGMAEYWNKYPEKINTFQVLLSQYFLAFETDCHSVDENIYIAVCRELKRNNLPFMVTSLNYDMLIEDALGFVYMDNERAIRDIIKPHGSPNFIQDTAGFPISFGSNFVNEHRAGSDFRFPTKVTDRGTALAELSPKEDGRDIFAPAISLYVGGEHSKSVRGSPEIVKAHREKFSEAMKFCSAAIIIGVRCLPQGDPHIWDPLLRKDLKVYYINPDKAEYESWREDSIQLCARTDFLLGEIGRAKLARAIRGQI